MRKKGGGDEKGEEAYDDPLSWLVAGLGYCFNGISDCLRCIEQTPNKRHTHLD